MGDENNHIDDCGHGKRFRFLNVAVSKTTVLWFLFVVSQSSKESPMMFKK